jgi:hypothetical protein
MDVRDAVEADAERLASLTDTPQDVMRNLIHDRTVRVAETGGAGEAGTDGEDSEGGGGGANSGADVAGFVSYDARDRTVHVTQIKGEPDCLEALLAEPIRFARTEGMAVELLVPEDEPRVQEAALAAGFETAGSGPRFGGTPTERFRLE